MGGRPQGNLGDLAYKLLPLWLYLLILMLILRKLWGMRDQLASLNFLMISSWGEAGSLAVVKGVWDLIYNALHLLWPFQRGFGLQLSPGICCCFYWHVTLLQAVDSLPTHQCSCPTFSWCKQPITSCFCWTCLLPLNLLTRYDKQTKFWVHALLT